ncbi:hypothetical protein HBI56_086190 [Parastagonospora nodorum]|uniref:Uncharacterized protein n=1 Tax=Phaeosphaeria nodorum (strain SN15 / ATCC MYA-4574 / FGSC 10173) TaxID=321614 RepID=A0A7U2FE16_PHANO|nr:hypothetical protein HBH56_113360 [Parastagonospora nodorum]QRD03578.1 hypothetical protein JI435_419870 [Parastagonospora nodorum SN15]KAH3921528.1 hypothetical protein HBH54_239060 [Parastagonospora nodorum]KAH3951212.1 hypothetical protein HBH53_069040 [Parastagonospora nodorum]KAH3963118.1 hypothetical protein HBH51_169710 [Parastagonospora nodorum]
MAFQSHVHRSTSARFVELSRVTTRHWRALCSVKNPLLYIVARCHVDLLPRVLFRVPCSW